MVLRSSLSATLDTNRFEKTVTIPVDGVLRTQLALREKPYIAEPIVINDHSRRLGQSGGAAQWVTVSGDGPLQPGNDPVRSLGLFSRGSVSAAPGHPEHSGKWCR